MKYGKIERWLERAVLGREVDWDNEDYHKVKKEIDYHVNMICLKILGKIVLGSISVYITLKILDAI